MPLISVVIAVSAAHNTAGILGRCVESILAQRTEEAFEIVMVGDGCHPNPCNPYPGPMPFSVPVGSGPSACRNLGILRSNGDLVAFLDADCVAAPSWLSALAELRGERPEVAAYAGRLVDARSACLNFDFSVRCEQRIPFVALGNACFRREALEALGPLDESLKMGGEDLDLSWRAMLAGMEVRYMRTALVFHRGVRRIGRDFVSGRRARAIARKYRGTLPVSSAFSLQHFGGVVSECRVSTLASTILQAVGYAAEAVSELWVRRPHGPVPCSPREAALIMRSAGMTLVRPAEVVSWPMHGDAMAICNMRSGRLALLEGAGAGLWRHALSGSTLAEAAVDLAQLYDTSAEVLARDLEELLADLATKGFLERRERAEAA